MTVALSAQSLLILAADGEGGGLKFPPAENLVKWPAWFLRWCPNRDPRRYETVT